MSSLSHGKGSDASASGKNPKPNLSIDTRTASQSRVMTTTGNIRSAPVGTRSERGIPPMFKAVDRYCARVAATMDAKTWRAQDFNEAVHVEKSAMDYRVAQEILSDQSEDSDHGRFHHSEECFDSSPLQAVESNNSRQTADGHLHLGVDTESVEIIGMHPCPKVPETSDNTMIISVRVPPAYRFLSHAAVVSDQQDNGREGRVDVSTSVHNKFDLIEQMQHDDIFSGQSIGAQSFVDDDDDDGLADRASPSIKTQWRCPDESAKKNSSHHGCGQLDHLAPDSAANKSQVTSSERQRFKELLDRLRSDHPRENSTKTATPQQRAEISTFTRKMSVDSSTKSTKYTHTDSGYASSSVSYSCNSRAQSDAGLQKAEGIELQPICIRHEKEISKDSGYESPYKYSTLNPAAREFSSTKKSDAKVSCRPPLQTAFLPAPQNDQSAIGSFSPSKSVQRPMTVPQLDQQTWLPTLPGKGNVLGHAALLATPPTLWHPGVGMMPQSHSLELLSSIGLNGFGAINPGASMSTALDLQAFVAQPSPNPRPQPMMTLNANAISPPLNQRLTSLGSSCNNPLHQTAGGFSLQPAFGTGPVGARFQSLASSLRSTPTQMSASSMPFIPKNVPKPKVPNTLAQQNWELMHELRRMNEPGYAMKCKEKQKKRYTKQVQKKQKGGFEYQEKDLHISKPDCDPQTPKSAQNFQTVFAELGA